MVLAIDDEGAARPGRDPVRDQLRPQGSLDIGASPHLVVEGACDEVALDIAIADLGRANHQGFDDVPHGIASIAIHERLGNGDGEGVARLWISSGGVKGEVQEEVVSPQQLTPGSRHRGAILGDVSQRYRPERDGIVLGGMR